MTDNETASPAPVERIVRRGTKRPPTQAQLRRIVGYEKDIARCENCKHYHGEMLTMRNSRYKRVASQCRLHDFFVQPAAICETWSGKDGSVLTPNA